MEVFFKRDVLKSYMVIKNEFYTGYDMKMFEKNRIPGFFTFETIVADGMLEYWYEISGMQILDAYLEQKQIGYALLEKLVLQIENCFLSAKKYLLSPDNICIMPDKIGIRPETFDISLCYIPQQQKSAKEQFRELTEGILTKIDHKDKKAVETAYAMYEVTLQDNYSFEAIKEIFAAGSVASLREDIVIKSEIQRGNSYEDKKDDRIFQESEETLKMSTFEEVEENGKDILKLTYLIGKIKEPFFTKIQGKSKRKQQPSMQISFEPEEAEEEVVNPTVLLTTPTEISGKLIYNGRNGEQDFLIKDGDFLIGTKEDSVDAWIHSTAVSRTHARIKKNGEDYYIEDLNSKNGT